MSDDVLMMIAKIWLYMILVGLFAVFILMFLSFPLMSSIVSGVIVFILITLWALTKVGI